MKIKVCGIRDKGNLHFLENADVDMIGFIFYDKSKRFFEEGTISQEDLKQTSKEKVGVFVNATLDQLADTVRKYQLDAVQLHGEETLDYCQKAKEMDVLVMKAFSVSDSLPDNLKDYEDAIDVYLFDTKGKDYGGNGVQFDWSILNSFDCKKPFIVSGGIGPSDVDKLNHIKNKQMIGVDVNSRFEIAPGLKDEDLVQQFINELKL